MAARLASLPLRFRAREAAVVVVIAALLGGLTLAIWATTPGSQRPVQLEGTILRLSVSMASKYAPSAVMEIQLADRRMSTVRTSYSLVRDCKVGDRIRLTETRTLAGAPLITVDPGACR